MHDNLCIVPKELALDFAAFCQRNPKPCPLIGLGSPGNPTLRDLGDLDIRTDLPRYCVFKDGNLVDEPTDVRTYWSDDLVTFVLGCSMSFELPLRLSCTDLCGGREVTRVPTATGCLQLLSSVTLISLANAGVVHARHHLPAPLSTSMIECRGTTEVHFSTPFHNEIDQRLCITV